MKVLIIGFGSIGQRHTEVLSELGHEVCVVTRRSTDHAPAFRTIREAVTSFSPDYAVVASKTLEHRDDIKALSHANFQGKLLIEKPTYDTGSEDPPKYFETTKVAFNMRFHPALMRFREIVSKRTIHAVTVYAGSYLPDWRPQSDYRTGYSAIRAEGGGVLRDLSHELDYVNWLFGPCKRIAAIGGTFGNLDIDSDDVFSILMETEKAPSVTIGVNYLDTKISRDVVALTDKGSVRLDFVASSVTTTDGTETFPTERNDTYRAQHNALISGDDSVICSISEGLDVMRLIDTTERAAADGIWMAV